MNWRQLHHLYIGLIIGFLGLTLLVVALPMHAWTGIIIGLILAIVGFLYALDDALQHGLGWNTWLHRLDVLLKRNFWLYARICRFFDEHIFK